MASVLVVDDDPSSARYLEMVLKKRGHRCARASSGVEALLHLEERLPALVVSDVQMPEMDGLELLRRSKERWPHLPFLLISVKDDIELVVRGVQLGALNYLLKPCPPARIGAVVEKALLERPRERPADRGEASEIIGRSAPMVHVRHCVALAARSDVNVLLCGETGTGKEVVARSIHRLSNLRDAPFVAHNSAATPRDLFESMFFGHRRGAFTGAHANQKGLLQRADGGTLFLDELEAMTPDQQAKLLRVLDEGEFRVIGATQPTHVEVRFLTATNQSPQALIRAGRLREDLYYRLKGFEIALPPLRARGQDILLLARHFAAAGAVLSPEALARLMDHDWPGNVRELRNTIASASIHADGGRIEPSHLSLDSVAWAAWSESGQQRPAPPLRGQTLKEAEGELIQRTIDECRGNQSLAARRLGIDRSTLRRKLAHLEPR